MAVRSVAVAGSFNNWSKDQHPMSEIRPGEFSVTIPLSAGIHYYKYVVNGSVWLYDDASDPSLRQSDGFDGFNSGIEVKVVSAPKQRKKGPVRNVPAWAREAVWYQIFPERFRNGLASNDPAVTDIREGEIPGWRIKPWGSDWYDMDDWEKKKYGSVFQSIFRRRYGGDLQGIRDKLDYLQDLGVTAIYLNPIFSSPSLHKYDASTLHHVDENFGPDPAGDRALLASANETLDPATWVWTSADRAFLSLVKEIHRRRMKVIIDGVFNHTGREFFAFRDILRNGKQSAYVDWYEITRWDADLADGFDYKGWFGVKSLPELKRDARTLSAPVKQYIFDITRRWLCPDGRVSDGADGWRLDVAFCVPHGFWKEWRRHVKSINPNAYITGEVVEPAPDFLWGDEFDALMNYPFAYAVTEFFIDRKRGISPGEFDRRLRELRELYPAEITAVMQNLLSSHDVPRLRTLIVNPDMNYRNFGSHFQQSKLETNPRYRIDRGIGEDLRTHKLIATFQMTYIGAPMIYYGDEAGMTGANDPDCRKPMLWDDIAYEDETVHPLKGRVRPRERNVVDPDLFDHYRMLIRLRRENAALRLGSFETVLADDKNNVFAFVREYKKESVYVVFNNSSSGRAIDVPITRAKPAPFEDILNPKSRVSVGEGVIRLTLDPKSAAILRPRR